MIATKLTQGAAHKGLEQLCQAVQSAVSALRSVDAKARLQNDQRLVSALLAKLPDLYRLKWDHHNAFQEPLGSETLEKFVGRHSARSREAQEQLYAPAKQTHHDPKAKPLSSFAALATDRPHPPLSRDIVHSRDEREPQATGHPEVWLMPGLPVPRLCVPLHQGLPRLGWQHAVAVLAPHELPNLRCKDPGGQGPSHQ